MEQVVLKRLWNTSRVFFKFYGAEGGFHKTEWAVRVDKEGIVGGHMESSHGTQTFKTNCED